jgi:hypothetical protein
MFQDLLNQIEVVASSKSALIVVLMTMIVAEAWLVRTLLQVVFSRMQAYEELLRANHNAMTTLKELVMEVVRQGPLRRESRSSSYEEEQRR